jgi:hypothetical protein
MLRTGSHHFHPFLWGIIAALAVPAFVKSKTAHKLAVNGVAGGMRIKDEAVRKAEVIREEAVDIYEEARRIPDEKES